MNAVRSIDNLLTMHVSKWEIVDAQEIYQPFEYRSLLHESHPRVAYIVAFELMESAKIQN